MHIETYDGIWKNEEYFEAYHRGGSIDFDTQGANGGCRVCIDVADGKEAITMTAEQFAAFKEWVIKTA